MHYRTDHGFLLFLLELSANKVTNKGATALANALTLNDSVRILNLGGVYQHSSTCLVMDRTHLHWNAVNDQEMKLEKKAQYHCQ